MPSHVVFLLSLAVASSSSVDLVSPTSTSSIHRAHAMNERTTDAPTIGASDVDETNASRRGASKQEASKQGAANKEAPKQAAPKKETPKQEAPQNDTPMQETPKAGDKAPRKPNAGDAAKPGDQQAEPEIVLPTLWVGDPAPALAVETWLLGEPVTAFEAGKVYLVVVGRSPGLLSDDWFEPLTELQTKHAGRMTLVATIGSSKSKDALDKARKHAQTHAAKINFALGYEKGDGMYKGWFDAARQYLLPPAYFLVDRRGMLAWIGDIDEIEPTLTQVLDDKFDLAKATEDYRREFPFEIRTRVHFTTLGIALERKQWAKVVESADKLIAIDPVRLGYIVKHRLNATAFGLGKLDDAYAYAAAFVDGAGKDSPMGLDAIAWFIVDPEQTLERRDLPLALRASTRAVELTKRKDAALLESLVMTHVHMGEFDKALPIAKEAAAIDASLQSRVTEIEAAIAARKDAK